MYTFTSLQNNIRDLESMWMYSVCIYIHLYIQAPPDETLCNISTLSMGNCYKLKINNAPSFSTMIKWDIYIHSTTLN